MYRYEEPDKILQISPGKPQISQIAQATKMKKLLNSWLPVNSKEVRGQITDFRRLIAPDSFLIIVS